MQKYIFACLLLVATAVHAAPLYKWVDEDGTTHFSERPPADRPEAESVDMRTAPSISGETARTDEADENPEQREPREPLMPVERVENPQPDPELCAQARKNIETIETNRRIRAPDPDTGEMRYLNEEEIAAQLENWQKSADIYCE